MQKYNRYIVKNENVIIGGQPFRRQQIFVIQCIFAVKNETFVFIMIMYLIEYEM